MRQLFVVAFAVAVATLGATAGVAGAQVPSVPAEPAAAQRPATDPQALLREIARLRQEMDDLRKIYGDRLTALEEQLTTLVAARAAATPAPPPPEAPPPAAPPPSSKIFNPDIAVIGSVMGAAGKNAVAPSPSLDMREAEMSIQAAVDPYARADFFVAFGSEGASLEEGYITFPTVPGGLLVRAGRMRTAFGKSNPLHPHVLPWPDRPLVMRNLVGGEEGLADNGVSVARLVPNPWFFLEATGQVFQGHASDVFSSSLRTDLTYLARLRGYGDISESTNIDLGTSFSFGHNAAGFVGPDDLGRFTTRLFGVDATLRYKPLRRSIYRSFIGRTELVWSRRQQFDGVQPSFGYFVSGDYQFARRWYAGLRYDRSNRADDAAVLDTGAAAVLTYRPSEFSQLRGMYRRTRYDRRETANEFLFQLQFAIGAHGAHPF